MRNQKAIKTMNVNASIKKQYLDMILRGSKTTEYRDMSPYWTQKLVDVGRYTGKDVQEVIDGLQQGKLTLHTRDIDSITFWCNGQRVKYQVLGINVYQGHKLFAIRLGKALTKG